MKATTLNVPKLLLGHAEVVPQFVHKRLADLMSDFSLTGADRFNVLLIKHDMGRTHRNIKDTDWFGGKSSTRIGTFWMRLRNSCGSESKASSATLTKSSRFIVYHADQ